MQWLHLLSGLGLGACLADDMGLGKTIQVLSLLLIQKRQDGPATKPSLLVAPASLLANWAAEIERFAPGLNAMIVHPSAMPADELRRLTPEQAGRARPGDHQLRLAAAYAGAGAKHPGASLILDEAQAIKNPNAKQTRAAKALKAQARIALTGTPVENHLGDLWSIFDFINPGLLGNGQAVQPLHQGAGRATHNPYGPLRELVRPYILRRMKTDKSGHRRPAGQDGDQGVLPAQPQAGGALCPDGDDLAEALQEADGIQRKGIVLATLMRLKQICNHPSQWLNDGVWAEEDSGKWARLREIAEVVAARQEKMLVFTQFREMTAPLAAFLGGVFGRPGLVLHGETAVKNRKALVQTFQEDETVPFFVLSLKAGGSGLTLTAASHVVHFDRWWNPAVENQATDRAFRIGQKKNVLVHKFVCQGTVEEKIDALIEVEEGPVGRSAGRRRRDQPDRNEGRRSAAAGCSRSECRDGGVRRMSRGSMEGGRLTFRSPSAAGRPSARSRNCARRVTRSPRSRSRDAPSPRPSGARRGATTWKATAITRTACRAAAPMFATARWSTFRSRRCEIKAMVSGSSIYKVAVSDQGACRRAQWQSICQDCAGGIDSLVELLQGRLSKGVMERLCRQDKGLFPKPSEIKFSCSCPDWASMCKHVAAVLYGVGARLDRKPELLFRLRAVNEADLVADLEQAMPFSTQQPVAGKILECRRRLGPVRPGHGGRRGWQRNGCRHTSRSRAGGSIRTKAPRRKERGTEAGYGFPTAGHHRGRSTEKSDIQVPQGH